MIERREREERGVLKQCLSKIYCKVTAAVFQQSEKGDKQHVLSNPSENLPFSAL